MANKPKYMNVVNAPQPVEFYQIYSPTKQFGWTPSVINMLGGSSFMDSYTPVSTARYTVDSYEKYLTRSTGKEATTQQLVDYLYKVADKYGIDRNIAYKQIAQESGFNPNAESKAGAVGIAQFIESTAKQYGLTDRRDPYASIDAWGKYMRDLLNMFDGDYRKALAGYNWGQGRVMEAVKKYGTDWSKYAPKETKNYLSSILDGSGGTMDDFFEGMKEGIFSTPKDAADLASSTSDYFGISGAVQDIIQSEPFKDGVKRVGLVVLAVILIAVAIISLR